MGDGCVKFQCHIIEDEMIENDVIPGNARESIWKIMKKCSLSEKYEIFGCLRRDLYVTILYKQTSNTVPGEFLGRLVLGVEDDEVKVFGATIY